jgi:hypothetical protein
MEIAVELTDLAELHPRLLWRDIIGATAVILREKNEAERASFELELQGLPDFEDDTLMLDISLAGILVIVLASRGLMSAID